MALSFYSNWETLEHVNPDTNGFLQGQPELAMEFLGFQDSFLIPDPNTDTYIDPDNESTIFSEPYNHLYPYLPPPFDHNSSNFPTSELDLYQYPKHQKSYEDQYYPDFISPSLLNKFVSINPPLLPDFSRELHVPFPDFHSPPVYSSGSVVESLETKRKPNGGCLSAQTIAARQRRRKITEKTQKLGKLIPGGQKMNTAEMFQSAFKYIKYLQAQVGILGLMGSIQDNEEPLHSQELQELVQSPRIQEKLYSSEKCMVPKQLVQTLANDNELQLNSLMLKELHQFIPKSG